jgi:hypothetical protein
MKQVEASIEVIRNYRRVVKNASLWILYRAHSHSESSVVFTIFSIAPADRQASFQVSRRKTVL